MNRVWMYWLAAFGIAAALAPGSALAQAGCCVCTSCTAPALFACREALAEPQCETTCTNLGCTAHQFNSGSECIDTPQCYGDCCDLADGACGQAHQADCTGGSVFFADSFCDGSNCVAPPPTAAATATHTSTPTATSTAVPSHSHTPTASATVTPTPTATVTASSTATRSAAASATTTGTPTNSPTPSVTPLPDRLTWLFNDRKRLSNIGSPLSGFTFAFPYLRRKPSLALEDSAHRFCSEPGLTPRVRLDLDPADCENECTIGVFPQDSTSVIHIAHLPALHRGPGTFDVLIDTVLGCEGGRPPTQLRMPAAVTYARCVGDCNGDDAVSTDELVRAVNMALGRGETSDCLVADRDGDGAVQIHELVAAVNVGLQGCRDEGCPIEAGTYTLTQTSGGMVQVGTLAIPFPAGGTMVLDVKPASQPACLHEAVVPYPGGFTSPAYCITGTGYTARLMQRGCGVGRVASSGGGDFTISELGDSSSQAECDNQQQCVPGIDDKVRVDVTVGDGSPDQCAAGQANAAFVVPVETVVWIDETMPRTCPAADGEYNPEIDTLLARREQMFDFTTDTNTVDWADLSGDGCTIGHTDPPIRFSTSGTCWDIAPQTISIAASGALGSASPPQYDTSFTAIFPSTVGPPGPPAGASCDAPPPIDFAGTAVRCQE